MTLERQSITFGMQDFFNTVLIGRYWKIINIGICQILRSLEELTDQSYESKSLALGLASFEK